LISSDILLLLLAVLGANLPWFSDKFLYLFPIAGNKKNLAWCLGELILLFFMIGAIAKYAEYALLGQVAPQDWEFYATTACLFLVFAFPGFVYKILWR
jgi:hypothetical protein